MCQLNSHTLGASCNALGDKTNRCASICAHLLDSGCTVADAGHFCQAGHFPLHWMLVDRFNMQEAQHIHTVPHLYSRLSCFLFMYLVPLTNISWSLTSMSLLNASNDIWALESRYFCSGVSFILHVQSCPPRRSCETDVCLGTNRSKGRPVDNTTMLIKN